MRVYLNRTFPCFSYIVLVACLVKVGHSAGAPLGAHILNSKGLKNWIVVCNTPFAILRLFQRSGTNLF